jgi:hypothetical protein
MAVVSDPTRTGFVDFEMGSEEVSADTAYAYIVRKQM